MAKFSELEIGAVFVYKDERFCKVTPQGRLTAFSFSEMDLVDFGVRTEVGGIVNILEERGSLWIMQRGIEYQIGELQKKLIVTRRRAAAAERIIADEGITPPEPETPDGDIDVRLRAAYIPDGGER